MLHNYTINTKDESMAYTKAFDATARAFYDAMLFKRRRSGYWFNYWLKADENKTRKCRVNGALMTADELWALYEDCDNLAMQYQALYDARITDIETWYEEG